jgi:hypothetical protein
MKRSLVLVLALTLCFSFLPVTAYAMQLNSSDTLGIDVTALGAKGDDKTDDTEAIQKALDQNDNVYIPAGTYMIDVEKSLELRSNQTLILDKLAVLQALPTTKANSSVIKIENASNVTISGGQIIGERYSHKGTSGEWGMGILIDTGADNVTISNMTISDCWGDGLYLGGTSPVTKITIDNVISANNRRQGLSITNAKQITIKNSVFKDTNGIAPEAGIDIEPNEGKITEDIAIINTQCYGNAGSGLDLMGINETIQRVEVKNSNFKNNSGIGIRIVNAKDLVFKNSVASNNYFGLEIPRDASNIKFIDMAITNNLSVGASIVTSSQTTGIEKILFMNSTFSNNSQTKIGGVDGIKIDNYDATGYVKDISFKSCSFIDDQTVNTQRYGITVGYTKNINNIIVDKSNTFNGNVNGDKLGGSAIVSMK